MWCLAVSSLSTSGSSVSSTSGGGSGSQRPPGVNSASSKSALKATNSLSVVKSTKKDAKEKEKEKEKEKSEKEKDDDSGDDNDTNNNSDEARIVADLCASLKAEPKLIRARIVGLLRFPKTFNVCALR
jgi:hypothetical protein